MSDALISPVRPSVGLGLADAVVRVISNQAAARVLGEGLMFDLTLGTAATFATGGTTSAFTVCVEPAAAQDGYGLYCVAAESIANGATGRAIILGNMVKVSVDAAASVGLPIYAMATNGLKAFDLSTSGTQKVVGIVESSSGSAAVVDALFDGFNGLGGV